MQDIQSFIHKAHNRDRYNCGYLKVICSFRSSQYSTTSTSLRIPSAPLPCAFRSRRLDNLELSLGGPASISAQVPFPDGTPVPTGVGAGAPKGVREIVSTVHGHWGEIRVTENALHKKVEAMIYASLLRDQQSSCEWDRCRSVDKSKM